MDIIYLGHSSFKISGKSASIVTDPYDSNMVGLKYPAVSADIVTVSHDHTDHNKAGQVSDSRMVIKGPGEYELVGVSIIGFPSFHDDKRGEERGKNTIYVIEVDDIRIAHLGDLGHKLEKDTIEEMGDIDILMIPTGGVYTINPTTATEVVQSIEPNITIPMHYFSPDLKQETFSGLSKVEDFLTDCGLQEERLSKLSVKSVDLGDEQKAVVLERKR
jgi:L-ascorbate metabolism protein UlaG (beta-lactamase superfamily)